MQSSSKIFRVGALPVPAMCGLLRYCSTSVPTTKELISKFENRPPAIVFHWNDTETDAKGWVVINSLRGGAAGGGTRMRQGLDLNEVLSLAKTMEVKFSVSGPPIGGAKSGIDFDPKSPDKKGVLERWYKAVNPLLKNYYGTGGDLNVDEVHEVIPITEEYGLWHPQEGIVQGHFKPKENQKIKKLGQLRTGVSKVLEDLAYTPAPILKYTVADFITGYGVSESVRHYYNIWGRQIRGKRAIVQGWGNVGAAAGFYLSQSGVRIVAIIDKDGGVINPRGFTPDEIAQMVVKRDGTKLCWPGIIPHNELMEQVWDIGAEIFLPCAVSRAVDKQHIERMIKGGLEVISSGANVPFNDPEIFMGPTGEFADEHVAVIPDFIANCGMARVFAYLMQESVEITDHAIFDDCSTIIKDSLINIHARSPAHTGLTSTAYEIALEQLLK